uniref:Rab28 family GTPase n=1 Tax=Angiostrongylus cantonensis TaxID=6313 RepID=A0A158PBY7_ANGCA
MKAEEELRTSLHDRLAVFSANSAEGNPLSLLSAAAAASEQSSCAVTPSVLVKDEAQESPMVIDAAAQAPQIHVQHNGKLEAHDPDATPPAEDESKLVDEQSQPTPVVVCGDGSSGKTSLCQRFTKDTFDRSYHQTLGLDFFSKRISLPGDVQVLMQVWDIGGQSIAGEMIDKYIYGSHAALIVYDVTSMNSFDNCQDWLNVIRRVTNSQEKPPQIVLVGNKVDEERLRKVAVDHHCRFAKQHGLKAFYVSAKTGDSVTVMFRYTS